MILNQLLSQFCTNWVGIDFLSPELSKGCQIAHIHDCDCYNGHAKHFWFLVLVLGGGVDCLFLMSLLWLFYDSRTNISYHLLVKRTPAFIVSEHVSWDW